MASRSINRIMLLGNLTRDPELKYTPAGTAVCTFGIATNRSWTTSDGQTKEETQYHRIVAWQKLAELCGKLLNKGKKVYLEGRITYREYTDKTGQQRQVTEVVLDDFIVFSDGRRMAEHEETKPTESTSPDTELSIPQGEIEAADKKTVDTPEKEEGKKEEQKVNPEDIPF